MFHGKFKVVITDADFPSHEPERRILGEIAELLKRPCKTEDELIELTKDADALLVQYARITRRVVFSLEKAKVIVRYGIGYENVDVEAATERGIYVANVPDFCVSEVADHTLSLILSLARKTPWAHFSTKSGEWDWKRFRPVHRLKGKMVGVIGLGKIGLAVVRRLTNFGFKIKGYDPYVSKNIFEELKIEPADLPTLLKDSDIVTVHVPLTQETHHLIGEKELRMMKETALLINTSRGAVIDGKALYKALVEGWIGAAALDVFEKEPLPPDSPLRRLNNLIMTPHMAWYSEESFLELQERTAMEVKRVLTGGRPKNIVNPRVLKLG